MDETSPHTETADAGVTENTVRNARPVWQEAILVFFTFTIYANFWLVGRVRDLKSVGASDFTPWLWFFVPSNALLQIFAFPRVFKELRRLESPLRPIRQKLVDWLWVVSIFVCSIIIWVQDTLGWSVWYFAAGYIVFVGLILAMHHRFNLWKQNLESVTLHSKSNGYSVIEWLSLLVGVPITCVLFYLLLVAPLLVGEIRTIEDKQTITNEELGFKIQFHGEQWTEVEKGSFSDGDTAMEFRGGLTNNFFIVFDDGVSNSLNDLARARAELRDGFSVVDKCEEQRWLSADEKSVVSYTECNGSYLDARMTTFSTLIESKGRMFELYGDVTAAKVPHKAHSSLMRKIAKGFSPL
jgi:hypothetical protein